MKLKKFLTATALLFIYSSLSNLNSSTFAMYIPKTYPYDLYTRCNTFEGLKSMFSDSIYTTNEPIYTTSNNNSSNSTDQKEILYVGCTTYKGVIEIYRNKVPEDEKKDLDLKDEKNKPTRSQCTCEKCQKWGDRSKIFYEITSTDINDKKSKIFENLKEEYQKKHPEEELNNFFEKIKVSAYPILNNDIIGELELHDAYMETYIENLDENIEYLKPKKNEGLRLCIPYDLPEGLYNFKIEYIEHKNKDKDEIEYKNKDKDKDVKNKDYVLITYINNVLLQKPTPYSFYNVLLQQPTNTTQNKIDAT